MGYLSWREEDVVQRTPAGTKVVHICMAPVEFLYVDDAGLLALTARGVERVPVPEEWR